MSELKNCPFCGGEAGTSYNTKFGYQAFCSEDDCILNTPEMAGFKTESEAITAWNARYASPRFTEEEREAMELVVKIAKNSAFVFPANSKFSNSYNKMMYEETLGSAIATVRAMLAASEIADKGKG